MQRLVVCFAREKRIQHRVKTLHAGSVREEHFAGLAVARRGEPPERLRVRDLVLAVARNHVAVGGDPLEEVLRGAVAAAVVLDLQQVDVTAAVGFIRPAELERLQQHVAARVARSAASAPASPVGPAASAITTMLDMFGTVLFR